MTWHNFPAACLYTNSFDPKKNNFNQANLYQVLAIFCKIDGFNRADFFVHPCVIFYDSLHANIM